MTTTPKPLRNLPIEGMKQVGRLAMRHEGEFWNAYYAMPGTMDGAVFLGSIAMAAVERPERRDAFMNLMRDVVADEVEKTTGVRPTWGGPQTATESERAR